jgi:hypothetical protein
MKALSAQAMEVFRRWLSVRRSLRRVHAELQELVVQLPAEDLEEYVRVTSGMEAEEK